MSFKDVLRLLFDFRGLVGRKVYAIAGFSLLVVKYAGDWVLSLAASERLDPISYLNPLLTARLASLGEYPDWLPWVMFVWALPFIWIGVSMTSRRAADAGYSPWAGLLFFVPVINNFVMLGLCLARSRELHQFRETDVAYVALRFRVAAISVLGSSLFGLVATLLSVYGAEAYGSALFIASPFIMGVIAGSLANRNGQLRVGHSVWIALLSVTLCGGLLMLFALEGVLCLAMAAVIAYPLAALGAVLGRALSSSPKSHEATFGMIALWPLYAFAPWDSAEAFPLRAVTSSIEVNAPPEQVWSNVVGFTDLPPPSEWLLELGVACPLRARIEGEGVGAIRYCEFTTGPFIEPITAWEPPHRLAFDVTSQPPSMKEWSPYEVVHAPHLVGAMQSKRGEFRLTRLPDNRTLLEGTTWYRLEMSPEPYWTLYSDHVIHVIHERVLRHVARLSETAEAR